MSILTRNAPASAKKPKVKITMPRKPQWLETYWQHLSQVLVALGIIVGCVIGGLLPFVPIVYLVASASRVPSKPIHNGWWIFFTDVVFSIFWYTAFYVICKTVNEKEKRKNKSYYR